MIRSFNRNDLYTTKFINSGNLMIKTLYHD